MSVAELSRHEAATGQAITAGRDAVVVPIWNAAAETLRCIEAIDRHTSSTVPFIFVDDRGEDRSPLKQIVDFFGPAERSVIVIDMGVNSGFAAACNVGSTFTTGDVAIVNSDVVVGADWFDRLRDAAHSSSLVATASTLTNHGTILSVPVRNTPGTLPNGLSVDVAAERVASHSLQLRPRIPTAVGHCMYLKRHALNLSGGFDESFGRGYGEEVDLSLRLICLGLQHVCADDVFVFHKGSASFGTTTSSRELQAANEKVINRRYPWYSRWVQNVASDIHSPLSLSIRAASQALVTPRVAVDARCLSGNWSGTQQATFQIIRALAHHRPDTRISVILQSASRNIRRSLEEIPNVEIVEAQEFSHTFDIIYRPYQVNDLDELAWLRRSASVFALSHLDLIAYHNPSYHPSAAAWSHFRDITRLALSAADGVSWISEFARSDAEADGFSFVGRPSEVVYLGTDPVPHGPEVLPKRPKAVRDDSRPFILQLGVAYSHKNRQFAVEVLKALDARGWNGRLVFAAAAPPFGSSLESEAAQLLGRPDLRKRLLDVGVVSEAEKEWLVQNASLALYPSTNEGFGLNPFEFARAGLATLASRSASLAELIPPNLPHIDNFDPESTADTILRILADDDSKQRLVNSLVEIADQYTWAKSAELTWNFLDEVAVRPRNRTHAAWSDEGVAEIFDHRLYAGSPEAQAKLARIDSRVRTAANKPIKRMLVPNGSLRQKALRAYVNRRRRKALS